MLGVAAAAGCAGSLTYQATSAGIPSGPPSAITAGTAAGDPQNENHDLNWLASCRYRQPARCRATNVPHAKQVRDCTAFNWRRPWPRRALSVAAIAITRPGPVYSPSVGKPS